MFKKNLKLFPRLINNLILFDVAIHGNDDEINSHIFKVKIPIPSCKVVMILKNVIR